MQEILMITGPRQETEQRFELLGTLSFDKIYSLATWSLQLTVYSTIISHSSKHKHTVATESNLCKALGNLQLDDVICNGKLPNTIESSARAALQDGDPAR